MQAQLWPYRPASVVPADVFTNRLRGAFGRGEKAPSDWREWLTTMFPRHFTSELGKRHLEFWRWVLSIRIEDAPDPFIGVWPRGSGKSTSAETGVVALGARDRRRFALYVRETQKQADLSVSNIAALLEARTIARYYPLHAERKLSKFGHSKGWTQQMVRTAGGFSVLALGLDTASRGVKLEEDRPDLIIFDDIDGKFDSPMATAKKIDIITHSILPAGAKNVAVLGIQNLINRGGVFTQLVDRSADFLADRIMSGPFPAIEGLKYEMVREGEKRYAKITAGKATWSGQSLETCQRQIKTFGINAFIRECQHDVKGKAQGLALHKFDATPETGNLEEISDDQIKHHIESQSWRPVAGIDFGAWRFACVLRAVDRQLVLHQIDEYFAQRVDGEATLLDRARGIHEMFEYYGLDPENKMTPIFGDAANPTDILELNVRWRDGWYDEEHGRHIKSKLRVVAVHGENKSRKAAVDLMNTALDERRLMYRAGIAYDWFHNMHANSDGAEMHESRLLWELDNWSYVPPRPGEPQGQDPDDATADGADMIAADRYCCMSHWKPRPNARVYGKVQPDTGKQFDYTKREFVEAPHAADDLLNPSGARRTPRVQAPRFRGPRR